MEVYFYVFSRYVEGYSYPVIRALFLIGMALSIAESKRKWRTLLYGYLAFVATIVIAGSFFTLIVITAILFRTSPLLSHPWILGGVGVRIGALMWVFVSIRHSRHTLKDPANAAAPQIPSSALN